MRVLLVEEGWHSTMYLARALADAGHDVTALTANGTAASCTHRGVRWISGPRVDSPPFTASLAQIAPAFDRILPLTEPAMIRLWDASGPWSDRLWPHAEPWQRRLVRDKHALVAHMAAKGIEVPAQRPIGDELERLPVVIKGATGCGGRMVRIVETRDALASARARAARLGGEWVAQELLPGPTYLFGGLFDRGAPVRIYAGRKLEQHPPRTGGAIALRSVADDALVELGVRAMRELRWTGFASADLMRRADGRPVLVEINPRLWGSLAGAQAAGVDLFTPFAALFGGCAPAPDLRFAPERDCWIFPRYLNAAAHRNLGGARRALRDLRGDQGEDWRDPRFVVHILRRLFHMKRQSPRF
ncbi:MAG TPA: ATP-grasp domain-containing protein [Kofleriaceae bacterium]|nr:ATP-grasp domain-containing protein [Kofleriaceae bacterium]